MSVNRPNDFQYVKDITHEKTLLWAFTFYKRIFPNKNFKIDGYILYYQFCEKPLLIDRRSKLSDTNIRINTENTENTAWQFKFQYNCITISLESIIGKSIFNNNLCRFLICPDVWLCKLKKIAFENCIEKYFGYNSLTRMNSKHY